MILEPESSYSTEWMRAELESVVSKGSKHMTQVCLLEYARSIVSHAMSRVMSFGTHVATGSLKCFSLHHRVRRSECCSLTCGELNVNE